MTLALPLRLQGDEIFDANDVSIALVRGLMPEYRERGAEIVTAVNSHIGQREARQDLFDALRAAVNSRAELLEAAYDAIIFLTRGDLSQPCPIVLAKLLAATAKAEKT